MSIFAALAVGSDVVHDGVRYRNDATHGIVIIDDNPPLEQIDASQVATGVIDPARLPAPAPVVMWHDAATNEAIAANGHYSLVAGRTLNLVDIGEGNQCWVRLADATLDWLSSNVSYDVPDATWTITTYPDPGPGSIITIICHSAAKQFTFQR